MRKKYEIKRMTLRMSMPLYEKICKQAENESKSITGMILHMCIRYLKEMQNDT